MIWPKRIAKHDDTIPLDSSLDSLRYVVIDTELTSLQHSTNRLLSVGAIAMQGASILLGEQFYRVVNPQVEIPAESVVVHQIRSTDIAKADDISKTLDEFIQFVQGAVLVGHFTQIDVKILRKEMAQTGHALGNHAIDTARVHQWLLRQGPYSDELALRIANLDLATVAKSYGLDVHTAHHALADAFLTACVWQKMIVALQNRSGITLKKLLKIGSAE